MKSGRDVKLASIIAYKSIEDLDQRQNIILGFVQRCPMISEPEISNALKNQGKPQESVSARLKELVDKGKIKVACRKVNRKTGRWCNAYEVVADV